jgi:diaminopropionate ammonia-lyase
MQLEWMRNPYRESVFPAPRDPGVFEFHRSMDCYRPTPLVPCAEAARRLGIGSLMVKDESARFGLNAFKILGASWAMSRLRAAAFSAATDGNHGRAVAWMARRLGASAHIFVPRNTPEARRALIRGEGAEVHVIEGTYDDAVAECAARSRREGWQVVSDTGYPGYLEIPEWIVQGYGTMFAELASQWEAPPDVVFIQAGVGGLLCAALREFAGIAILVSVEPLDAACLLASISSKGGVPTEARGSQNSVMQGLNCGQVSLTAWPEVRRAVDVFAAIADEWAGEAMELLAPMDSGPSGAAGVAGLMAACSDAGLRRELGIGAGTRVLCVNTEAR